jgi:hypothetical protein
MTTRSERQEFVACFEAYYWNNGFIPDKVATLNYEFNTHFSTTLWEAVLTDPKLVAYFKERGVPNPYAPQPVLTPKQLDFIRAFTDPTNVLPLSKKLSSLQVSQAEFASWMRDTNFITLVRGESDKKFRDSRTLVLNALAQEAAVSRNVNAIKFYFELTGEYTPGAKTQVNVQLNSEVKELTIKLLEVLQRHVPPETLELIHGELEQVLFPDLPTTATLPARKNPRVLVPTSSRSIEEDLINEFG